jgi:3-keto-5-aminohexanoate cleavage enzyme
MVKKYTDIPTRYSIGDLLDLKFGLDLRGMPKWQIPETVVIKAAVVGAPIKRTMNPYQPYTPDEIKKEAMECIEAGATSVHVHPRTDTGEVVTDKDEYKKRLHLIIDPIKAKYGNKVIR